MNTIGSSFFKECPITEVIMEVRGISMDGLFSSGEKVKALIGYYACHEVSRKDIIILRKKNDSQILIKSVVMLPGDHFYLRAYGSGFQLLINDEVLLNSYGMPYLLTQAAERVLNFFEINDQGIVPEGKFYVFGNNPHGSIDSSNFGPVSKDELIGFVK